MFVHKTVDKYIIFYYHVAVYFALKELNMDIMDFCSEVDMFDIELDTHFTYEFYTKDTITEEDGSVFMTEHQVTINVEYWAAPVSPA